jgi:tRNA pseudouridine13 synthase
LHQLPDSNVTAVSSLYSSSPMGPQDQPDYINAVVEIETAVLADWQSWCYALEHAGLKQERRNLILRPENLHWTWLQQGQLQLSFSLPAGAYATALLREIAELFRPEFNAL